MFGVSGGEMSFDDEAARPAVSPPVSRIGKPISPFEVAFRSHRPVHVYPFFQDDLVVTASKLGLLPGGVLFDQFGCPIDAAEDEAR